MARNFDGQVALITGAGGGLGRDYALLLGRLGASVVVNDYGGDSTGIAGGIERAESVAEEIRAAGGTALADATDVSTNGGAIVGKALKEFGRLDAVINNAGIASGGDVSEQDADTVRRVVDVHLHGAVNVLRAAWPVMVAQRGGRIVNTSSSSVFGMPGTFAYISAKGGLFGLTRALAQDGKRHGIRVNAVMPTAYSRMTAKAPQLADILRDTFTPESAAPFVVALCHPDVPCTGETFTVGGGRAAKVVLSVAPGLLHGTSVDECLDRFDEAMSTEDAYTPADAMELLAYDYGLVTRPLDADTAGTADSET